MARQRSIKPEQYERELQVLELRRAGGTWSDIARVVGYNDASAARKAYVRVTDRTLRESAEEARELELDRLDRLMAPYWGPATRQGDRKAAEFVLKVIDRRAKLLGLDAPTKVQAEVVTYDSNSIRAELDRIIAGNAIAPDDSRPPLPLDAPTSEAEPTTD